MGRVVHFEIPAENPQRSADFYQKVFNWKITKWEGPMDYWLIDTGDGVGINGGLMSRHDPSQPLCVTIDVENLDETIKQLEAAGGQVCVPKMPVPGVGWLAYFKDTEGIIQGIMQSDPSAGN